MADLNRRIERIERLLGDADCLCTKTSSALIVIDDDWSDERKKSAEASVLLACPTHGMRLPNSIVRISRVDANL